jgi:DNA-binding MarR family transcriptional regulator
MRSLHNGEWSVPISTQLPCAFTGLSLNHLQATAFINKALAPLGLVRGTFDVLTALRRNGAPYSLRPKQLATALLLSGAGLASHIDQLEALRPERGRLIVREDSGIRNVRDIKGKASH